MYRWIEVKYPYDVRGFDGAPYDRAVRRLVRQTSPGISIHVPTNYDLGAWSDSVRSATLRCISAVIEYGASLGATVAVIHPGTIHTMDVPGTGDTPVKAMLQEAAERKKERARQLTAEALRELAPRAAKLGMTLALENVLLPQEVVYTAGELARLVLQVDHPSVRATFDAGHAHRRGLDPAACIRELSQLMCHVHLNDNDGTCDLHLPPGEGMIDFVSIFRAMEESGYSGAVVAETIYQTREDLAATWQSFSSCRDAALR
jgi:sugar phosphate isomerase/epimerase